MNSEGDGWRGKRRIREREEEKNGKGERGGKEG